MGVKLLNTFLKVKCPKVIQEKHWEFLSGKKIVVDINNYMYKFLSEDNLEGGFIRMCDMFLYYKIIPLFVFDGKPPKLKKKEIRKRAYEREETKKLYEEKKHCLCRKKEIELKRKMVTISVKDIENIKNLLHAYGMKYIKAPNESDELCCMLVNCGKVYACLSEDMDMFVYGCKRILRKYCNCNYINFYEINTILNHMKITMKDFRYLTLVSNIKENIFKLYNFYNYKYDNFINNVNNKYLNTEEEKKIVELENYYDLEKSDVLSKCNYILIKLYNYYKNYINSLRRKMSPELHFYPT